MKLDQMPRPMLTAILRKCLQAIGDDVDTTMAGPLAEQFSKHLDITARAEGLNQAALLNRRKFNDEENRIQEDRRQLHALCAHPAWRNPGGAIVGDVPAPVAGRVYTCLLCGKKVGDDD